MMKNGGELVRDLISSGNYCFANNAETVIGGPHTWISPSDENKKSILDVFIISKSLEDKIDKLIIDDQYDFPIQYPVKIRGETRLKRSDHLTLILYLKNLAIDNHQETSSKNTVWNYKRKGAWEAYKKATSQVTMEFPDESNINVDVIQERLVRKIKQAQLCND